MKSSAVTMWWIPLITVHFCLLYSPSGGASVTFPVHTGCFETSFVERYHEYYRISHPLTWDDCEKVCNKRLTMFAGIQIEKGSPTYNYCYCGNDLQKQSAPAVSLCKPCEDKADRFCGGEHTMSVYHLRESTPVAVLLAVSHSGIQLLTNSSTEIIIRGVLSEDHAVVDFLYAEDEVFFVSHGTLYRSDFNYLTLKYAEHIQIKTIYGKIQDITIDWIHKRIYFSDFSPDIVYETLLNGTTVKSIIDRNWLKSLSLDPYSRVMYFNEKENSMFSYDLENKSYTEHNQQRKLHVQKIKCMAVDIHEQMIYIVGTLDNNDKQYMTSINLKDQTMRALFEGPQLTNVSTLDVFKNEAVWVNYLNGMWQLYRCKLTPKCHANYLTPLGPPFNTQVADIKIYHPEKQTPTNMALCRNMTCSHICERISLFEARCVCPQRMVIGPDGKNCQDAPDDSLCQNSACEYFKVIVILAVLAVVFMLAILLYFKRLRVSTRNQDVAYRHRPNDLQEVSNIYEDLPNTQVKMEFQK